MSAWERALDELVQEAISNPIMLTEEMMEMAPLDQAKMATAARPLASRVVSGWLVMMSYTEPLGFFNLSAALHPYGRSSDTGDWEMLGRITAHVGAAGPLAVPDDANAPIHFVWTKEKG